MNVLEIGSGGVNAAYLQELVGSTGKVTTVDIDRDGIAQARQCLDDADYTQVKTVLENGEHGVPAGSSHRRGRSSCRRATPAHPIGLIGRVAVPVREAIAGLGGRVEVNGLGRLQQ